MKTLKTLLAHVSDFGAPMMILLFIAVMTVNLVDRFSGNGEAWTFYAPDIDMTCIVGKDEGQKAMYCLNGDHRVEGATR